MTGERYVLLDLGYEAIDLLHDTPQRGEPVTATIRTPWGETIHGEIRCWMGRRWVEVEDSDGRRHIGRLPRLTKTPSTVDSLNYRSAPSCSEQVGVSGHHHDDGRGPQLPPVAGPRDPAVAGLAREVEALRRHLHQLRVAAGAGRPARRPCCPVGRAQRRDRQWTEVGVGRHAVLARPARRPRPSPESSRAAQDAEELLTTLARWVGGIYLRYPDAAQTCRSAGCGTPRWSRNCSGCTPPGSPPTDPRHRSPRWGTGTTGNAPAWCAASATTPASARWRAPARRRPHTSRRLVAPHAEAVPVIAAWWAAARDRTRAGAQRGAARHRADADATRRGRR